MKNAIIVSVYKDDIKEANHSLDELENLANTLDIKVIDRLTQKCVRRNSKTYVGSGKLDELKALEKTLKIDYIIFDDELTPAQLFNLDEALETSIIDRTYLILEIFRKRASTPEAKLQIKLANLRYLLPRIQTFHEGFDRQGGNIGSKGSGETQLELDRRDLSNQIVQTKAKLDEIILRKKAEVTKRKNSELKTISLVGYTNAGKSSTLNTLLKYLFTHEKKNNLLNKSVEAEDLLFKTLDTSVRKLSYKNVEFLLSDTIGFISKTPATVVDSFFSTLEEVKNADLIIIVLDATDEHIDSQFMTTIDTLNTIGVNPSNKRFLLLFNKVDLIENINPNPQIKGFDTLIYSNKDESYVIKLLNYIHSFLIEDYDLLDLKVPYTDTKAISMIENNCSIVSKLYFDDHILFQAYSPKKHVKNLSLYKYVDIIQ